MRLIAIVPVLVFAAQLTADPFVPADCATFAGLPGSTAPYHFTMAEIPKWQMPGNTVEPVYQCKLPFTLDDVEKLVIYVTEPPGSGSSEDFDPGPSPFSDIVVLDGNT